MQTIPNTELHKGTRIRLTNDWEADLLDNNRRGLTRLALVYGTVTEAGSVYASDISQAFVNGKWQRVRQMPTLAKAKAWAKASGFSLTYRDGEYRLAPKGLTPAEAEAKAYYTTSLFDALDTAKAQAPRP